MSLGQFEELPYRNPEGTNLIAFGNYTKRDVEDYINWLENSGQWPYGSIIVVPSQPNYQDNLQNIKQALDQGPADVISAGGDGTHSAAMRALASLGFKGKLAPTPFGNANDISRMAGIKRDGVSALLSGKTITVPSIDIQANQKRIHAFDNAGFGFTAEGAKKLNSSEYRTVIEKADKVMRFLRSMHLVTDPDHSQFNKFVYKPLRFLYEYNMLSEVLADLSPLIMTHNQQRAEISGFTIMNGHRMAKMPLHYNKNLLTSKKALYEFTAYNKKYPLIPILCSIGDLAVGKYVLNNEKHPNQVLEFTLHSRNDQDILLQSDGEVTNLNDSRVDTTISLGELTITLAAA